ncbi:LEUCINE-RICH REPEAT RECEPTOR-LIKE PROTEIN KINASE FAMILY PROTEIN-RELATED [Salix purpurea]|uniref:LEUCINE-RICH REPEAT RECEPTOR-LIKE PROTEIN KINASE FAMILY PROTEIN-RELATED n=1 Tax=Salix purpurea TaxID=77065 RepID=A0A9Q0WMN8_SALPP|nr:LEUCINE-RICH REPEAT RECEPTOR-LIKE PROTEIN KINASE FAMILY PROTEIN-RELATED [Salix purpurea]
MLLFLFLSILSFSSSSLSLNQEGLYLQQTKLSLSDPDSALSSWSDRDTTPCSWSGIKCDPATNSVTSIDLSNTNVAGPFPSLLCRLQNLTSLSFSNNNINSTLPLDISACQNLQHLDLSQNLLTGTLPHTLADLPNLRYLDLTGNNFSGNITTLRMLNLSYNPFTPGRIPPEFGNFTNLEILWLSQCNLIGEIPDSLGRLKKLRDLDLAYNNLVGSIPKSLTELTSVVQIELYNNSLTGGLPRGMGKLTELKRFDASMNRLTGWIPDELCQLPLESLNLYENGFTGTLPPGIADSPNLYELRLFQNGLTGELPQNLGKNAPLRWLDVSNNNLTGQIPASLCQYGELEEILMIYNSFSGQIPESLSHCRSLTRVRLGYNRLSGEVPTGLWGLPRVSLFDLVNNSFSGPISKTVASAANLSKLIIDRNNFDGSLPEEIGFLANLSEFSGSENRFNGSLPGSIVNLKELGSLDLHGNALSGELPDGVNSWKKMNELNLANNAFSGNIPDGIAGMSVLNYLDLSNNRFSGKIPTGLQNLKLNKLNLSSNRLSGEIPPLFAKEMYKSSFIGNPGLCGDIEGLCDGKGGGRGIGYAWLMRSVFALAVFLLIFGLVWFYFKYRNFKKARAADKSRWTLMSFHNLGFSEYEILDCLDEDNVIGSGSSGKVYKVVLSNGEAVAVKKLWGAPKKQSDDVEKGQVIQDNCFDAEVATLKYAYTLRVNEKSDIYSFGVVILELVTGKRPVDPDYGEKDLVNWVCTNIDQKGVDHVIDSKLDSCFKEEISKVLNIAILCTNPLPINRPSMRRVVKMLQEIGAENQSKTAKKDGKLTPYYYEDASDHGSFLPPPPGWCSHRERLIHGEEKEKVKRKVVLTPFLFYEDRLGWLHLVPFVAPVSGLSIEYLLCSIFSDNDSDNNTADNYVKGISNYANVFSNLQIGESVSMEWRSS